MPTSNAYKQSLRQAFAAHLDALRTSGEPASTWSQEKLALDAKLDRTYVGQLENAEKMPSIFVLQLIADALGRPLADVVPEHAPPELHQPPESERVPE